MSKDNRTELPNSRTYIYQPKIRFNGGTIKWFDDTKLIRKEEVAPCRK